MQEIFEKYGEVSSATVVIDYDTKQSKGYGFVKMPDRSQGLDAIASLNGREIDGVPLVVNETKFQRDEGRPGTKPDEKPSSPKQSPFSQDRYAKPHASKFDPTRRPSRGQTSSGKKSNFKKK